VNELNTHELAWAAGFFDGEGSTIWTTRRPRKAGRLPKTGIRSWTYHNVQLSVSQSGQELPEVLTRFKQALGIGWLGGPYVHGKRQPIWHYSVSGFERVQAVVAMLWRYLSSTKRAQAKRCLLGYLSEPVLLPGSRGEKHPFAKLNDIAVRDIRRRHAAGERLIDLAAEFGVDHGVVSRVARGHTWRHIQFEDGMGRAE